MQRRATGVRTLVFVSTLAFGGYVAQQSAVAASPKHHTAHHGHKLSAFASVRHHTRISRTAWHGISCVPFAREESGIDLPGNARDWWSNAVGVYARGAVPQPGAVLAFEANTRMRLGHVAVVDRVINRREIEVDQANWGRPGAVTREVPVIDVSEENDWSAVRVAISDEDTFGAVYPTYGFIYHRPDNGTMVAAVSRPGPSPDLNPVKVDLRATDQDNEVAEAPALTHVHTRGHSKSRHHVAATTHRSSKAHHT